MSELVERHGTAKHPNRPPAKPNLAEVDETVVAALGKLSEALEAVEYARGLLYGFHRLCGTADLTLQRAVELLHAAGQDELAEEIDEVLVGRDVIAGMWSFQLVEAYDAGYWQVFRDAEHHVRARLTPAADAHLYEANMKHEEQA